MKSRLRSRLSVIIVSALQLTRQVYFHAIFIPKIFTYSDCVNYWILGSIVYKQYLDQISIYEGNLSIQFTSAQLLKQAVNI